MTTDYVLQDSLGLPGINRDQTPFQTKNYVDGQHTRFYNNEPRKIGGYLSVNFGTTEIVRGMFGAITGQQIGMESGVNAVNLYSGRVSGLTFFLLNNNGETINQSNVTPVDYVNNPYNMWLFDQFSIRDSSLNVVNYILALVTPANRDIGTEDPGAVYYGLNGVDQPFVPLGVNITQNGFVCVSNPYIFLGGQQGIMQWNTPGTFDFPEDNFLFVSDTRLVVGKTIRGGNTLAILVWSLNGLYRVTFNPNIPVILFSKETISSNISIISQNCVVEVPEISTYFWIGQNCFYQYNGVVSELRNDYNKLWFFNNINPNAKEKCWTYVNSAYNEVWFFFPFGTATECTNVVVYNYLFKTWFDTASSRSCGIPSSFLSYPIQADSQISSTSISTSGNTYNFWMHEYGTDMDIGGFKYAIKAYIRSHDRLLASLAPNQDLQTRTRRLEADMFLNGQMYLKIYTKQFPSSDYEISRSYELRDPVTGRVGKTDIVNMGRIVSYYFESNEVGGFFQFGRNVIDWAVDGSERPSR